MIGRHNGLAAIIKREVPDLINIHCVCHRHTLACAQFAAVQSGLLNLLPKDQLSQAKKHMKKAKKAVASLWLSFDESVRAMVQEFIAHSQTFEFFKESDATASGLLMQTRSHQFIDTPYILKEILTHLAVLSKTLQRGELCFPGLPSAVSYCLAKLDDVLKRKDEILRTLSVDLSENGKLPPAGMEVTPTSTMFLNALITSYVGKLKENIAARFPSLPLVKALSIFDFQVLPVKEYFNRSAG